MPIVSRLVATMAIASLLGAGCFGTSLPNPFAQESTPAMSEWTPAQASERLQFLSGDTFEIRQTFLGLGARLPDLTKSPEGVRYVTVTRFAPFNIAELKWNALIEQRTPGAATGTLRVFAVEKTSATGTILGIGLKKSHTLFLPVYWKPGVANLYEDGSGVWLSDDAFQELTKTQQTILNFGIVDEAANAIVKNATELRDAWNRLRKQAASEGKRKDLTLLEAEAEPIEHELVVNGKPLKVSALRARNWFGEILVLNSRQNPLILKLTLNPLLAGVEMFGKQGGASHVFGFEITNLTVQAVQSPKP
jgi:hypothetical protein